MKQSPFERVAVVSSGILSAVLIEKQIVIALLLSIVAICCVCELLYVTSVCDSRFGSRHVG